MFGRRPEAIITFRCDPELFGVIPPPIPAGDVLPGWFKKLPPFDPDYATGGDTAITVKRCMPFLDAMNTGHLLLLAADIRLEVNADGSTVNSNSPFPREMVSSHKGYQYKGAPGSHRVAMKFHNFWTVKTPPGWSTLFLPALNRDNATFDVFSGVVDTDTYETPVNIPFFMKKVGGIYTLNKGTPMVQLIPFKRSDFRATARASTVAEMTSTAKESFNLKSMQGWYRQKVRAKR